MAATKPWTLGELNGKKYFLDIRPQITDSSGRKIDNPTYNKIVWKIPDIRESICAEPGYKVLSCDYSQIEVRLMAHLSGDPWLIAAINSGKDIHCYFCVDMFGAELEFTYEIINTARKKDDHPRHEELSKLRSDMKATVFGVPYGAGPPRIAIQTGKTIPEAAALIDRYFTKAFILKQWLENQGRDALRYGYSTSPKGRKRFYVMPSHDDPEKDKILSQIRRWAGNHPIQAGNVDMLKPAMKRIYDRLRALGLGYEDARILFVVHDEIVMTAKEEYVPIVRTIMAECMKSVYDDMIKDVVSGFEQKDPQGKPLLNTIDESTVLVDVLWKKD
jgi:DNA polymerase I